jgi:hypothetical protein
MSPSMAGPTMTGAELAMQVAVMMSLARPLAMAPSQRAVAGATRMASAVSAATMCPMRLSDCSSSGSSITGRPDSASSVSGPMKWVAASLIITCTSAPARVSSRSSSAPL